MGDRLNEEVEIEVQYKVHQNREPETTNTVPELWVLLRVDGCN